MYGIIDDRGYFYAGGFGTNTGVKWTTWRPHASWGNRNEQIKIKKLLQQAGFKVRLTTIYSKLEDR